MWKNPFQWKVHLLCEILRVFSGLTKFTRWYERCLLNFKRCQAVVYALEYFSIMIYALTRKGLVRFAFFFNCEKLVKLQ